MKHFDELYVSPFPDNQGRRRVLGLTHHHGRAISARHVGYLMPSQPDSRQQPKSLAFKLREQLNRRAA